MGDFSAEGVGFSLTKPLEFFGNLQLFVYVCSFFIWCPTGALLRRKSRGPVRVVLDCGDGRSDE